MTKATTKDRSGLLIPDIELRHVKCHSEVDPEILGSYYEIFVTVKLLMPPHAELGDLLCLFSDL